MKKRFVLVLLAALVSTSAIGLGLMATDHSHDAESETVNSHSGGTDAYGCHTNHKTNVYHCH